MIETTPIRPQWIARMYAGSVGRDHLGLGSVASDQILPTLSPGINVLTQRPRYYSFYTFLLDEFIRRGRPASRAAWVAFFRPREFIFALGAHLRGHIAAHPEHAPERSAVGTRKINRLAVNEKAAYNTQEDYIDSDLGGYGLYYRTVMAELEIIYLGGPGYQYPIDIPSETIGRQVAAQFRAAVEHTRYYRHYFDQDVTEVPLDVIVEYIDRACLCQLQHPAAPERALLLERFLFGGAEENAASRRATFRLLLDLAHQTEGYPIDQDTFRQLIYFGAAENGAQYRPLPDLEETGRRWRHYQAHEYYSFALNALWDYLCAWGLQNRGDIRPLPLDALWQHVEEALDFGRLAARLGLPNPRLHATSGFSQLRAWLESLAGAGGAAFDAACGLDAPLHEHKLYRLVEQHRGTRDTMVAGMITMLALIDLRFGRPELWQQPEWELARMGQNGRLPLDGFVRSLRRRLESPVTIFEVVRWLYSDYVIQQHIAVATGKLPDNTFRFQRQGGRLQFYQLDNSLRFMDSRYDALSTIVNELGLCGNLSRPGHALTADGRRLLEVGAL